MHKLTIEDDEGKTVVVPLIRDEITVGRQEGNSIRLTERNISRRHARFFRQNGSLFVEDLSSFNGIKVNGGKLVAPASLKDGDLVIIGDYKLTVRADRPMATRLYGSAAPFTSVPSTAPISASPLATTAALPGDTLGAQTQSSPLPSTAPPPSAALDAAPTIPVRTLAEQSLVPGQGPGLAPARLVVVTTNLAGTEFVLDRPSLVMGRTPENDIVLNHKSISRHHAKVIRDGDKYIVVDLESANGVRVNGGEFERVELKSGDTLELGHVRLRFTSGADYVDFDIGEAGRSRRKMAFAGVGGAVVLAGFALTFAMRGGNDVASTEPIKPAPPSNQLSAGSPDPTPAPMPPVTADPSESAVAPDTLLAKARAAQAKENWDGALEAVKAALEVAPLSQEALTLREAIQGEQEASVRFGRIKEAARTNNHEEVLNLASGIPEGSIYQARTLSLRRTAQARLITQRLAEMQKFAASGACAEARAEADKVLALEPNHDGARTAIERCERVAARAGEKRQREEREAAAKETADRQAQERAVAAREEKAVRDAKEANAREARQIEATARAIKEAQAKEAKDLADKQAREKEVQARAAREAQAKEARDAANREAAARAAREAQAKEAKEREAAAARAAAKPVPPAETRPVAAAASRAVTPPPQRALAQATPPRATTPPPTTPAKPASPATSEAGVDPEALLKDAQQAWLRGQYMLAIDNSRRALKIKPGLSKAYEIIAACSCSLHDADEATKAYSRLDEKVKPLVKTWCQKSGISLN